MKFYGTIERVSGDDERMVWGYASTNQQASDGLTITTAALEAALDDYMAFANIREMHQLSAVGKAREAKVDDGGLFIGAWVQDDDAWSKVKAGIYQGFSIGAKVTSRDHIDRSVVTGISLYEISLVDRPADPGAVFEVFRATSHNEQDDEMTKAAKAKAGPVANTAEASDDALARAAATPVSPPTEVAAVDAAAITDVAGTVIDRVDVGPKVVEASKTVAEATDDLARAAETEAVVDPVTSALAAAEAAKAGVRAALDHVERAHASEAPRAELPGADIRRGLGTVNQLGWLMAELAYLTQDAALEAAIEGDTSAVPTQLRAALLELAKAYKAMSDEELAELLAGVNVDVALENGVIQLAACGADVERSATVSLSDETAARLQSALDGLITRGFKPKADKIVEVLTTERAELLRTVQGLTSEFTTIADRLAKLEAQPLPPKTAVTNVERAVAAVAVGKEEDATGKAPQPSFTTDEFKRALDAMPEGERAELLVRAALARPHHISR